MGYIINEKEYEYNPGYGREYKEITEFLKATQPKYYVKCKSVACYLAKNQPKHTTDYECEKYVIKECIPLLMHFSEILRKTTSSRITPTLITKVIKDGEGNNKYFSNYRELVDAFISCPYHSRYYMILVNNLDTALKIETKRREQIDDNHTNTTEEPPPREEDVNSLFQESTIHSLVKPSKNTNLEYYKKKQKTLLKPTKKTQKTKANELQTGQTKLKNLQRATRIIEFDVEKLKKQLETVANILSKKNTDKIDEHPDDGLPLRSDIFT